MTERRRSATLLYRLGVGLLGAALVVLSARSGRWLEHAVPLAFFVLISVLVKRSGFHAVHQANHSLVGLVDIAVILIFGPVEGALVAGASGVLYRLLNALRRERRNFDGIVVGPVYDGGLRGMIALASGNAYMLLGGVFPLPDLQPGLALPLLALLLLWFVLDHLVWSALILVSEGARRLRELSRTVLPISLVVELMPQPLAIVVAAVYSNESWALFGVLVLGILGAAYLVQRFADARVELEGRIAEAGHLAAMSEGLARTDLDVHQLCERIHEYVQKLTAAPASLVALLSDGGNSVTIEVLMEHRQRRPPMTIPITPAARWMQQHRQPLLVRDVAKERLPFQFVVVTEPVRSALLVPMLTDDTLIGIVSIQSPTPNAFGEDHLRTLISLGALGAVAIQKARLYEAERRRGRQLALVNDVGQKVASVLELDRLFSHVVNVIRDAFAYFHVELFTVNPASGRIRFETSTRPSMGVDGQSVEPGQGMIGWVAVNGTPLVSNDVKLEPRYRKVPGLEETRSEAAIPLLADGETVGVLDVQSDRTNAFTEADVTMLQTVAAQVAIAIQEARLYESARKRARQLATSAEVSRKVVSILDLDELLHQVVALVREAFSYQNIQVLTVDSASGSVVYRAGSGLDIDRIAASGLRFDLDGPGIVAWVAREGEPALVNDVTSDPRYLQHAELADVQSELAVPLRLGNHVLGVLDVQSRDQNAFTDEDLFILSTLSDQIAVAVRNAGLYASERQKRQEADTLRRVSAALSSTLDESKVLSLTLDGLRDVIPHDLTAILLGSSAALRVGAVRGPQGAEVNSPGEISLVDRPLLQNLITTGEAAIFPSTSDLAPIADALGDGNCIGAPLRAGDETIGAILICRRKEAGQYSPEQMAVAQSFATQAALAIQNSRLYAAQKEDAWVTTALLEVAEAISSLTNVDEILETVVRLAPMVVGVSRCSVFLWDPDEERFQAAKAYGLHKEQEAEFARLSFAPGDTQLFDRLAAEKQAFLVTREDLGQWLPTDTVERLGLTQLVALPLLAKGEVLGALLAELQEHLQELGERPLSLISGIATQTAAAIESARLYAAVREEAWVSTALLQVADSVGRYTDLDEILEGVVRITPFLVGVDRCTVFLWSEPDHAFKATRAFGLRRDLEPVFQGLQFRAGDFPLLDQVQQYQQPIEVYDVGASDLVPNALAEQFGIKSLLALPLIAKGEVVGVMIVDFADTLHRFPAKRTAILSGIAGQAAMAIETARLYSQAAEQRRMEQELELAREIQRSFLPKQFPSIPGWQLSAYWQAARQVGGDFYDFIPLPKNRLGIVIADVSDKGVPAALFMAMSRTMLRAAALESASPAEVLKKTNTLIVANAESGMFVTAFYGILDPQQGKFTYASGGHNPPILARAGKGTVEKLSARGIALGVLEEIELEERTVELGKGDSVVLYTDGVTDAINEREEDYGMVRLLAQVQALCGGSATEMVNGVTRAVAMHVGGESQFDDFTLVVLNRAEGGNSREKAG